VCSQTVECVASNHGSRNALIVGFGFTDSRALRAGFVTISERFPPSVPWSILRSDDPSTSRLTINPRRAIWLAGRIKAMRVNMREVLIFIVILGLVGGWVFDHAAMQFAQLHLKYRSQSVLHESDEAKIVLTEHQKPGFLGMQVWQVWRLPNDGSEPVGLITVERRWQESQPLQPVIRRAGDEILVSDDAKSFAFDIPRGEFTENKEPESVYKGTFRYSLPPLHNP
jgi:hypothetical protein